MYIFSYIGDMPKFDWLSLNLMFESTHKKNTTKETVYIINMNLPRLRGPLTICLEELYRNNMPNYIFGPITNKNVD